MRLVLLFVLALTAGCPAYGVMDDTTSVSCGPSNRGTILAPARLPVRGEGYRIGGRWQSRGLHYGTEELIAVIEYVGRVLSIEHSGVRLGVGDLSPARGGDSAWHRSHQTGRDVDLLFFVRDSAGHAVETEEMVRFNEEGLSSKGTSERFDVALNWQMVVALIENPVAPVQYIFVHESLAQLMLDHAVAIGESTARIEHARAVLRQPSDSAPHDDHMHVRIYCSATDIALGCIDKGAMVWAKKDRKYRQKLAETEESERLVQFVGRMPTMFVLGGLLF